MEQMFNFGLIAGCLGDLCAIEFIFIMEPFLNNQTLVKDFFTDFRCWDKLEQILPHELVEIVMGCPLARFVTKDETR